MPSIIYFWSYVTWAHSSFYRVAFKSNYTLKPDNSAVAKAEKLVNFIREGVMKETFFVVFHFLHNFGA